MAVGTVLLTGTYLYIFSQKYTIKNRFIILLTIEFLLDLWKLQGAFLQLSSFAIGYRYVNEIVLFFYSGYILIQYKNINRTLLTLSLIVLFLSIIGISMEIFIPYQNGIINAWSKDITWDSYADGITGKDVLQVYPMQTAMLLFQLVAFFVVGIIIKQILDRSDIYSILDKVIKYSYPMVLYGYFEFFIKNILNNSTITYSISAFLLGVTNSTYTDLTIRGLFAGIQGFTREPSHYAEFLGLLLFLMLIKYKIDDRRNKNMLLQFISIVLIMLISGSFSAIWLLVMSFLVFVGLYFNVKKIKIYHVIPVLLCILFGFNILVELDSDGFISKRIDAAMMVLDYMFSSKTYLLMNTGDSSLARMLSLYDGMQDFLQRPILGIGLGIESAFSAPVSMLLSYGVLGTFFLGWFYFYPGENRGGYHIKLLLFFLFVFQMFGGRQVGLELITLFFVEITSLMKTKHVSSSFYENEKK